MLTNQIQKLLGFYLFVHSFFKVAVVEDKRKEDSERKANKEVGVRTYQEKEGKLSEIEIQSTILQCSKYNFQILRRLFEDEKFYARLRIHLYDMQIEFLTNNGVFSCFLKIFYNSQP